MTDKTPITERDLKSSDILASKRESLQEKIDQETLNRALRGTLAKKSKNVKLKLFLVLNKIKIQTL